MTDDRQNGPPRICGLPMFTPSDPEILTREREYLTSLDGKSLPSRWRGYLSMTGPGYLQSAMTLGSGSAISSLYLGAHYGYKLLWVQPLAMVVGIIMLMAASHQTLSTCVRPFEAMRRYVHPALAWGWAIATLVSTVIWHLPQYAVAAGVTEDMVSAVSGRQFTGGTEVALLLGVGVLYLVISTAITWNYGSGWKGIKLYEKTLKTFIWVIIAAFALVIARSTLAGRVDWGGVISGFIPLHVPTDPKGVTTVMAAFSSAVGLNMTFLFGYTQLARGWSREHRGLARFDLITGMLIPYAIITSLVVIAAGCTIHGTEFSSVDISPTRAGVMIGATGLGPFYGRIVFGLGILGMALSTITLQMLVCGFAFTEMLGMEPGGWRYKLACLIPAPAFLGVILWKYMGTFVALPTSAICLLVLPIAYVGWFILQNSGRYLGRDKPTGASAVRWNAALMFSLVVTLVSVVFMLVNMWRPLVALVSRLAGR